MTPDPDAKSGKEIRSIKVSTSVLAVAADGKEAYGAQANGTVFGFSLETLEPTVRKFPNWHASGVISLAIAPNGKLLASTGNDGRVILYELPSGKKTQEWQFKELKGNPIPFTVNQLAFSPDSRLLATANTNGTIYLFRVPEPAQTAGVPIGSLPPLDPGWLDQVAKMPAEQQVKAVADKLKERNLGFDGKVTHKVKAGVVTELRFLTDNVTDIAPVRALTGLQMLRCNGSGSGKGKLADLSPLKDMKLTNLYFSHSPLADLSPLKGNLHLRTLVCNDSPLADLSPLKDLQLGLLLCQNTRVSDLSPLKDMRMTQLNCNRTNVADLSPLADMRTLTLLDVGQSKVTDLAPLKNLRLGSLWFQGTQVTDLSPLKELKLTNLRCDFKRERDTAILRSIKTLKSINHKTAVAFWKAVDAGVDPVDKDAAWYKAVETLPAEKQVEAVIAKLKERNPGFDGKVTHKIEDGVVTSLAFLTDKVSDIAPVRALAGLQRLTCNGTAGKGQLADPTPLVDMELTFLDCSNTKVTDLAPLKEMSLIELRCDFNAARDSKILRSIKTLETINGQPAQAFWKAVDQKKP